MVTIGTRSVFSERWLDLNILWQIKLWGCQGQNGSLIEKFFPLLLLFQSNCYRNHLVDDGPAKREREARGEWPFPCTDGVHWGNFLGCECFLLIWEDLEESLECQKRPHPSGLFSWHLLAFDSFSRNLEPPFSSIRHQQATLRFWGKFSYDGCNSDKRLFHYQLLSMHPLGLLGVLSLRASRSLWWWRRRLFWRDLNEHGSLSRLRIYV